MQIRRLSRVGSAWRFRRRLRVPLALASHVEASAAVQDFDWHENFSLHLDVISEEEEQTLLRDMDKVLRRRRYMGDHWDGVILRYREIGMTPDRWSDESRRIQSDKILPLLPQVETPLLEPHALDLSEDGAIFPHVDNKEFSGVFVAGLSLLSSAVMRLEPERDSGADDKDQDGRVLELLLQPRSLYVLKAELRYSWTHEVLGAAESAFRGQPVPRERRVSVIYRDAAAGAEEWTMKTE